MTKPNTKTSPFQSVHEKLGARFGPFHGWLLPEHYGDPETERRALSEGSAAFDLSSFGRLSLAGDPDGQSLADLVNGAALPDVGRWASVTLDDPAGRALSVRIARLPKALLILTRPTDRHAVHHLIAGRARHAGGRLTDVTEKTGMLAVYGPRAYESVTTILPFDPGPIEPGAVLEISQMMISVTVLRGSWLDLDGIELICPAGLAPLAAGAIAKYHERQGIVPAGMHCLGQAMQLG